MEKTLCMFQSHRRRSVEYPSLELQESKWVERVTGLVEYSDSGEVVSFAEYRRAARRNAAKKQPRQTNVNPS
jgi:hypothetical protein